MYLALLYWFLLAAINERYLCTFGLRQFCAGSDLVVGLHGNHRGPPFPHPNDDLERIPAGYWLLCPAS